MDEYYQEKEKPKRKAKGRPPRYRRQIFIFALVCVFIIGTTVYMLVGTTPIPSAPFSLVTFDVSEATDQIALSWSNGTTSVWGTRSWSDVKAAKQNTVTNFLGGTDQNSITSLDYHPQSSALLSLTSDQWAQLNEPDAIVFRTPGIVKAIYSGSGTWLALLDKTDHITLFQTSPNQAYDRTKPNISIDLHNLSGNIISIPSVTQDIVISPDDTLIAVLSAAKAPSSGTLVNLIEIATSKVIQSYMLSDGAVSKLVFKPDGTELALTIDSTLYQLNLITGDPVSNLTHLDRIVDIDYSSSREWLAISGAVNREDGTLLYMTDVYKLSSASNQRGARLVETRIGSDGRIVKAQFVGSDLLIGDEGNTLVLAWWNGAGWVKKNTWTVAWPS